MRKIFNILILAISAPLLVIYFSLADNPRWRWVSIVALSTVFAIGFTGGTAAFFKYFLASQPAEQVGLRASLLRALSKQLAVKSVDYSRATFVLSILLLGAFSSSTVFAWCIYRAVNGNVDIRTELGVSFFIESPGFYTILVGQDCKAEIAPNMIIEKLDDNARILPRPLAGSEAYSYDGEKFVSIAGAEFGKRGLYRISFYSAHPKCALILDPDESIFTILMIFGVGNVALLFSFFAVLFFRSQVGSGRKWQ